MASLIQQRGNYYAQFYDADRRPKRKRIPLKTSTKRAARRLLSRAEDRWALGEYDPWKDGRKHELFGWEPAPEKDLSTVGKAVDGYLDDCSHLAAETQRTYREILRLFERDVGPKTRVKSLTSQDVEDFLHDGLADATKRKYVSHLGYLFRYLIHEGWMEKDLSKEVPLPKQVESPPKALTRGQQRQLMQAVQAHHQRGAGDLRFGTYFYLLLLLRVGPELGLRIGEWRMLKWSDEAEPRTCVCDLDAGVIRVYNEEELTTKSGRMRVVPIPNAGPLEQARERRCGRYVLEDAGSPTGTPLSYSTVSHAFARFRDELELPGWVSLHSLRHAYGTRLAEAGVPIHEIKRLMGHSSTSVTEQYMHASPEQGQHHVDRAFG